MFSHVDFGKGFEHMMVVLLSVLSFSSFIGIPEQTNYKNSRKNTKYQQI